MKRVFILLVAAVVLAVGWLSFWTPLSPLRGGSPSARRELGEDQAPQFTSEELDQIESYLSRLARPEERDPPARDIFRWGSDPRSEMAPEKSAYDQPPASEADAPRLMGFILSSANAGQKQPLAAIQFEGRMWLVGTGEMVGPYSLERMVVGEEVYLVDETGEGLLLMIN